CQLVRYFAGMGFVQMEAGMSREQATAWVARNIPPDLSRRISSKPIRKSTVGEWMYQYGSTLQVRRQETIDPPVADTPNPEITIDAAPSPAAGLQGPRARITARTRPLLQGRRHPGKPSRP